MTSVRSLVQRLPTSVQTTKFRVTVVITATKTTVIGTSNIAEITKGNSNISDETNDILLVTIQSVIAILKTVTSIDMIE